MQIWPQVVREVLLAVFIEELSECGDYDGGYLVFDMPGEELGLYVDLRWTALLWLRGPFLAFFNAVPAEALRFVIELTDFATDRYCERCEIDEVELPTSFSADGRIVTWHGDADVFGWYKNNTHVDIISNPLITLEY